MLRRRLHDRPARTRYTRVADYPSSALLDSAQRVGREIGQRGIPVDPHDQIRLGEQRTQHVHDTGRRMLFTQVDSWMMGINSNLPGRQTRRFIVYAGGAPRYREKCDEVAAGGYVGFTFR